MSGAFSTHLLQNYNTVNASARPPGSVHGSSSPPLIISGAVSFSPNMHGNFGSISQMSMPFGSTMQQPPFMQDTFLEMSEATATSIATLQAKLNQRLGPEYISQRPGPGGGPKLTYIEGWKAINLANEVFGFNGWSSSIVNMSTDFMDYNEETKRCTVGTTAVVRVTLRDGVFHEDVGYGQAENAKGRGAALEKAKKEAVTDGLKRALRTFGNMLGNCLYDKSYTQEVVKIKVQPPKFDQSQLHRRPEFAPPPSASTSTSAAAPSTAAPSAAPSHTSTTTVKQEPQTPVNAAKSIATPRAESKAPQPATTKPAQLNAQRGGMGLSTPRTTPRVSFAPPQPPSNKPKQPDHEVDDNEMSSQFGDEDLEFLAEVDMGEGDLGRPIDFEEGMSAVTDEGVSMTDASSGTELGRAAAGQMPPPAVIPQRAGPVQQQRARPNRQQIELALASADARPRGLNASHPSGGAANSRNTNASHQQRQPGPRPQQQQQQQQPRPQQSLPRQHTDPDLTLPPTTANVRSSNAASSPNLSRPSTGTTSKNPNANQQQQARVQLVQQAQQQRPQQNQPQHHLPPNQPQPQPAASSSTRVSFTPQSSSTSSASTPKPRAPSMGGFDFPPGVGPSSSAKTPPAAAGVKRSADAMQGQRRPAPNGVKREPFGQLDVGDGGDVKRARR